MAEIELSYIQENDIENATIQELLKRFSAQTGIHTSLHEMNWQTAWNNLLTIANQKTGPDISLVGSTWVATLAEMDVICPINPALLNDLGGRTAFPIPVWESTKHQGDHQCWSIPWTYNFYVICYRKDLLTRAGIDENTAFSDIHAISDTIQHLASADFIEIPWLFPTSPAPYLEILHMAASWIWSAGGNFLNETNNDIILDHPNVIEALSKYFESFRAIPDQYKKLDYDATNALFQHGRVAAIITDIHFARNLIINESNPIIRSTLGIAPLTDKPWIGGSNLVLWKHALRDPEHEHSIFELIKFLYMRENNLFWSNSTTSAPTRLNILNEIFPEGDPLHGVITQNNIFGKSYPIIRHWDQIEFLIATELKSCLDEAYQYANLSPESILLMHIRTLKEKIKHILTN